MSVYERNPDPAPDSEFESGEVDHWIPGNTGRCLDPRRTPFSVVEVRVETGLAVVRIEDFEDRGALWEVPFEDARKYQFARGAERAEGDVARRYAETVDRLDRELVVPRADDVRPATLAEVAEQRRRADAWLAAESRWLAAGAPLPADEERTGPRDLQEDLRRFMAEEDLASMEDAFARQYVRNPGSGELVKGHRIVIAERGLARYEGTVVRDPALFDGEGARERRARHVVSRLAFVQAFLSRAGRSRLAVHRGLSTETPLEPLGHRTFVSATTSLAVARSHYDAAPDGATRVLLHQHVPIERVFMTYFETAAMNEHYKEAEVVLLCDEENLAF